MSFPERCYANLYAHSRIAEHRHTKTRPDRLVVVHLKSELTHHFGCRSRELAVGLRQVVGINVRDVRPVEPDGIEHKSYVVESTADLCFNRNSGRIIERLRMPAALPRYFNSAVNLQCSPTQNRGTQSRTFEVGLTHSEEQSLDRRAMHGTRGLNTLYQRPPGE